MASELILFPCNGNALEALDCIQDQYKVIAFVDDDPNKINTTICGVTVYSRSFIFENPGAKVLAIPGSPSSFQKRKMLIEGLSVNVERFTTVVHSKSAVSKYSHIGVNTLIMAGVVIGPNVRIGNHVVILPNTVIHHDCVVEDFSLIGSNVTLAGGIHVRSNCYISSGSSLINNIVVGENSIIGLGSNVIRDIKSNSKNAGNPAREL